MTDMTITSVVARPMWGNLMGTAAEYTKREATELRSRLEQHHGGVWDIERNGRQWRAYQILTREQKKRLDDEKQAQLTLSDQFDWFNGKAWFSIYKTRDTLKPKLDAFREKFEKDPFYEMRWATDLLQVIADYRVADGIIAAHEKGESAEFICRSLERTAERSSDSLSSQSTSPMSNLMDRAERIAVQKFAKDMRSWLNQRNWAVGILAVL